MECRFAFLCDYAQQDGKLHAVGIGWDVVYAVDLPASPPSLFVVAHLRGSIAEAGTKQVGLRLIDADGADVIPALDMPFSFTVKPGALEAGMALIFNLTGVKLPKYGAYGVYLLVNGNEVQRLSFSVVKPPTTA